MVDDFLAPHMPFCICKAQTIFELEQRPLKKQTHLCHFSPFLPMSLCLVCCEAVQYDVQRIILYFLPVCTNIYIYNYIYSHPKIDRISGISKKKVRKKKYIDRIPKNLYYIILYIYITAKWMEQKHTKGCVHPRSRHLGIEEPCLPRSDCIAFSWVHKTDLCNRLSRLLYTPATLSVQTNGNEI